jgi:hypothetical protein
MVYIVKTHRETGEKTVGPWTESFSEELFRVRMRADEEFPIGHYARHYGPTRVNFDPTFEGEVAYLNSMNLAWTFSIWYVWTPGDLSD